MHVILIIIPSIAFCQYDTIYSSTGKVIGSVKEIGENSIKFTYPNEDLINNLNKNVMALQTFRDLFAGYPTSNESDNAVEFVRNIFIEDQTPELFVQFMNDFGKSLSTNEQDSLVYRSAIIKYEQRMYPEAAQGFTKYLQAFPKGKYQLDANYLIAEIAYSKEQYDTAAKYFGIVADQSPNKFAERAALLAARLNYFNLKNESLAESYFSILLKIATQQENKMEAYKGLLRCQYKAQKWEEASITAQQILADKSAATDDIQMANMSLFHYNVNNKDTSAAYLVLSKIIKSNPSTITADAHYQLAALYLAQNKLSLAEKTAFDVIKKQAAYDYWVTKAYILLGDIYTAQKDYFNAIATYKSVAENANDATLKLIAQDKTTEEISKEVFGDKVDDIMNLMAQAAGTRQGLKLVQNVLGGIVPRGGKDLQRILSKDADKIADAIENDPRMFEMLMHKLGETKAGQQLQELLKKSPEGKELFDEVEVSERTLLLEDLEISGVVLGLSSYALYIAAMCGIDTYSCFAGMKGHWTERFPKISPLPALQ